MMTHRPSAPKLISRHHRDDWRKPRETRLLGAPIAVGSTVILGWDGPRMIILDLTGVRPEWGVDALQAIAEALRNASAHQEEAAS